MKYAENSLDHLPIASKPSMLTALENNIDLAKKLKVAMVNEEISAVFQYIYDVVSNKVIYVEFLARWRDYNRVYIPPNIFLQTTKESGLTDILDEYIIEHILTEFKNIRKILG
ncbi:MAG: EAL domain-containing protein [Bacilli bacterium]|jgi:EAL domain-containing protein (putative c-di-GMP-specific phosphodiesterase class I)|nr:EAL domain-containing protein [Bacilli bacterium]